MDELIQMGGLDTMSGDAQELISAEAYSGLLKALSAGANTTVVGNNYSALQVQSMETTLVNLTFKDQELTLWRDIPKAAAKQLVEEYAVMLAYGDQEGFVGQMESPLESDPIFKRGFGTVKYVRQQWRVSDVSGMVDTILSSEIAAKQAATRRLLRDINRRLYSGNSTLVDAQFDGFETIIKANGATTNVIDARDGITQKTFDDAAEVVRNNLGVVEGAGLYMSPAGVNTLSQVLKVGPALASQRVIQGDASKGGAVGIGLAVDRIFTNFGTIQIKTDIFIGTEYEGRGVPQINDSTNPGTFVEGPTSVRAPSTPTFTATVTGAPVTGSKFSNTGVRPAGVVYNYRVAAGNQYGLSVAAQPVVSSAITVAGQGVSIAITPAAGNLYPATYYEIYSEKVSANGDYKLLGRIAANGAAAVTFVDSNLVIPGTTKMFLLPFQSSGGEDRTAVFKRLAPLYNKPLAPIDMTKRGILNLMGMPLYYAPRRFVLIENVPIGVTTPTPLITI